DRAIPMLRARGLRNACLVAAAWSAVPWLAACGASDYSPHSSPNAVEDAAWTTLLTGEWTRSPGSEGYTCVRKENSEDIYVDAFDAINPLGTHHTLLTMGAATGTDGTTDCTAADVHPLSVFGSGVGTNPLEFPKGVAVRIPQDTQLLLNLHLFNTSAHPL